VLAVIRLAAIAIKMSKLRREIDARRIEQCFVSLRGRRCETAASDSYCLIALRRNTRDQLGNETAFQDDIGIQR